MVETYLAAYRPSARRTAATRAASAARAQNDSAAPVRYVRSIFIPGDETCFHVFEAVSLDIVRVATEQASIPFERIMPVVQIEARGKVT